MCERENEKERERRERKKNKQINSQDFCAPLSNLFFLHARTVCPCVQRSDETRRLLQRLAHEYQAAAAAIGQNPRYATETFAVNVQPFLIDTEIPRTVSV